MLPDWLLMVAWAFVLLLPFVGASLDEGYQPPSSPQYGRSWLDPRSVAVVGIPGALAIGLMLILYFGIKDATSVGRQMVEAQNRMAIEQSAADRAQLVLTQQMHDDHKAIIANQGAIVENERLILELMKTQEQRKR